MTPKIKAKELFEKCWSEGLSNRQAKECAMIVCNEVLDSKPCKPSTYTDTDGYWKAVKEEIKLLKLEE